MYNINDKVELIKGIKSRNRIVMPPMDTSMAQDGFINDFHIQHYGARAYGGVGTIIVESTAVSTEGRIRENDLGLWKDEQVEGYKKIVNLVHQAGAVIGIQLNHAGAKADLNELRIGPTNYYNYLNQNNFRLITDEDIKRIEENFVSAAKRAKTSGADFVEIHGAHGYLISEFLHPTLNTTHYEKTMLKRAKLLINILKRISNEVEINVGIKLSVVDDILDSELKIEDNKELIKEIEQYVDYFQISSGSTIGLKGQFEISPKPVNKMFRIPYAKKIMEWTTKPVITVGNFNTLEDVNYALEKQIPFVAIGRELIYNPNLVLNKLLTSDQIDDKFYHWNNNIWYNPHKYAQLMEKLKYK